MLKLEARLKRGRGRVESRHRRSRYKRLILALVEFDRGVVRASWGIFGSYLWGISAFFVKWAKLENETCFRRSLRSRNAAPLGRVARCGAPCGGAATWRPRRAVGGCLGSAVRAVAVDARDARYARGAARRQFSRVASSVRVGAPTLAAGASRWGLPGVGGSGRGSRRRRLARRPAFSREASSVRVGGAFDGLWPFVFFFFFFVGVRERQSSSFFFVAFLCFFLLSIKERRWLSCFFVSRRVSRVEGL